MSEATQSAATAAKSAVDAARAHLAHIDPAAEVVAGVKDHPGVQQLMKAAQSHGEAIVDAVHALTEAVEFDKIAASAAAHVEGGAKPGHAHVDVAKMEKATAKLKSAANIGPITKGIEKLAADGALIKELKDGFAEKGLTGGTEEVRGALKSINVDQIGVVQQLEAVIAHAKTESDADVAGLTHLQKELKSVNDTLKQEISALLAAVDTLVAKLD
jgi:hypothetical protein